MGKSLIRFDGSAHWYTKEGKPQYDADLRIARKVLLYPSPTSIEKDVFPNLFLDRWKLNQLALAACQNPRQPHENDEQYAQRIYEISTAKAREAAEFGSKLHNAVERYPMVSDDSVLHWFTEYAKWHEKNVRDILCSEQIVIDHDIGVAGKMDRKVIMVDGRVVVMDYKSQDVKLDEKNRKTPAFYDSWKRQLSFYAVAEAKTSGMFPDIPECLSLVIDSNQGGLVYPRLWTKAEILHAYQEFLVGAWRWFHTKKYWPQPGGKIEFGKLCSLPLPL